MPPRVLCLGHALKESLSAEACRDALVAGVTRAGGQIAAALCLSDGGDGFLAACAGIHQHARLQTIPVTSPTGRWVGTTVLHDADAETVYIECALTTGLAMVPAAARRPMELTSAGLGDAIAEAIGLGARRLVIGIGGTATCDGGLGMLRRLEDRLLHRGRPWRAGATPLDLEHPTLPAIDRLRAALSPVAITVCSDVVNPLLGRLGAARRFGPQKGATPDEVFRLEQLLDDWSERLDAAVGEPHRDAPGSGAAGGIGYALRLLGATIRPGAELLCDELDLEHHLAGADWLLTAEGRFDASSLDGKAPWTAARRAANAGRRAAILCASVDEVAHRIAIEQGVVIACFGDAGSPEQRRTEAADRLAAAACSLLRPSSPERNLQ